ncbi:MAG TPA: recombination protein RecR [Candidatus Omnitrophica bacterium]|nr:recombination protein RecR [Candidatus Omnitrophota bacterium]
MHPPSLRRLIEKLAELPSLGPKSAERIALSLMEKPQIIEALIDSLNGLAKVKYCKKCNSLTEGEICSICEDPKRDKGKLCIVEEPHQVDIIERSGIFKGTYYVLGGSVSPLEGKGPEDLRIEKLFKRIKGETVEEIILATNQDFTTLYMIKLLKSSGVKVSCLAKGIPVGSKIEYVDELTLREAFKGRKEP